MGVRALYLSLRGRIGRKTFWLALLPLLAGSALATFAVQLLVTAAPPDAFMARLASALMMIVSLATLVGFVAVCVKRLHDRNRSGWWLAGLYGVGILLVVLAASAGLAMTPVGPTSLNVVLQLIMLGALLWLIVELGILPGTRGPNAYGPDPLETA